MADLPLAGPRTDMSRRSAVLTRLVASPSFQAWAARFPVTRRLVRREGEAMFDLVAGFCHSQILRALIAFDIPAMLMQRETSAAALARLTQVPLDRMQVLLNGGAALGLIRQRRSGDFALTRRGAALAGVPGLAGMIAHHDVLYRDLADPAAFFRGETETELAAFWPYVFGAGAAADPQTATRYSALMADSQALVAADTLAMVNLRGVRRLLDVGGGTGAFLHHVGAACPGMALDLLDLPGVASAARTRFGADADRLTVHEGSFRDADLPLGSDAISLIRVLYDHADDTVADILRKAHRALPPGGRVVISEPMTGGAHPQRAGDAYFALYCMAMRTGKARSARTIAALLADAGFGDIRVPAPPRPFITSVVEAVRPG